MCADENVYGAVGQSGVYLVAFFLFCGTGEQLHAHAYLACHGTERLIVLCGENLGGSHQACLESVVDGNQSRHQRHYCLAASHIALQQAVHLTSASEVGADFVHHAFLRPRKGEWQHITVETVEKFTDAREDKAFLLCLAAVGDAQYVELDKKQLFKLKPQFCLVEKVDRLRKVDIFQRVAQRNQVIAFGHGLRQRFRNERGLCQQVGDERLECF